MLILAFQRTTKASAVLDAFSGCWLEWFFRREELLLLDTNDIPGSRVVIRRSTSTRGCNRKYKRMMNNRQSAARSRARKQAYTNQLEMEVARLVAENDTLRIQCDELRPKVDAHVSKEKKLQRILTAPF